MRKNSNWLPALTLACCGLAAPLLPAHAAEARLDHCRNIMPLGDSITLGVNGGYRNELYRGLQQDNCGVSFVGSQVDEWTRVEDADHEGHAGIGINELKGGLAPLITAAEPEIILLMIGTNDLAWWTAKDAAELAGEHNALLDDIRRQAPDAWVFVASIPPQSSEIVEPVAVDRAVLAQQYNAAVQENVRRRAEAGEPLRFVDLSPVLSPDDLYDGIHPDEPAHDRIAAEFLRAIRGEINRAH